jgi:hypothetical protein
VGEVDWPVAPFAGLVFSKPPGGGLLAVVNDQKAVLEPSA